MARRSLSVACLLLALILPACKKSSKIQGELNTPLSITDAWGQARRFRLYPPPNQNTPAPLMVYFHAVISPEFSTRVPSLKGYTGSPVEETGLIPFCRSRGIYLLVPEAHYTYTFLGCTSKGWVVEKELDGVERMIDAVARAFPIEAKEIYLAGISAGAVLCHYLANHRPNTYAAILSHSQAYMDPENRPLQPAVSGPRFGVLFAYTRGDYPQLKEFCIASEKIYRAAGYHTKLLADLPPDSHRWTATHNSLFWKLLKKLSSRE